MTDADTLIIVLTDADAHNLMNILTDVIPGQALAASHTYGNMHSIVMAGPNLDKTGRVIVASVESWSETFACGVTLQKVHWLCPKVHMIEESIAHCVVPGEKNARR